MTHEFYQEALQRLEPGGVLASFIPYSGASLQKLLLRTFRASFRYVTVIRGPRPYGMYLLGSQAPMVFHASTIMQVFGSRAAHADLASAPDYRSVRAASWPSIIHKLVWMTDNQVSAYAGSGPLLTDDHPLSEYFLLQDFGVGFERPALDLALVVTGLLGLLVVSIGVDALRRRRIRPSAGTTSSGQPEQEPELEPGPQPGQATYSG
jgi:hypothetical protein